MLLTVEFIKQMLTLHSKPLMLAILLFSALRVSNRICWPEGMLEKIKSAGAGGAVPMKYGEIFDKTGGLDFKMECQQLRSEKKYLAFYAVEQLESGQPFIHAFVYDILYEKNISKSFRLQKLLDDANLSMIWFMDCYFTHVDRKKKRMEKADDLEVFLSDAKFVNLCHKIKASNSFMVATNDDPNTARFPTKNRVITFRFFFYDNPVKYPLFVQVHKPEVPLAAKIKDWSMSNALETLGFSLSIQDAPVQNVI